LISKLRLNIFIAVSGEEKKDDKKEWFFLSRKHKNANFAQNC